jgi:accessory colonization factor AcfC
MIKKPFFTILISMTVVWCLGFQCDLDAQDKPLRIYGPEGPFAPIKECADLFYWVQGVKTEVLTSPGSGWIAQAKEDADVVYEETENRLSQFMMRHP